MRNDAALHVEPILLWQCICGGPSLPQPAFQHVLNCDACGTLAEEITDALNDLQNAVGPSHDTVS